MNDDGWQPQFQAVYERGVVAWSAGRRSPGMMFSPDDAAFLAGIGCSAQELFDFVDDGQEYGEPDFATVLAVQKIRRAYFLSVMGGTPSGRVASMADLPTKTAAVEGIAWLPRLIAKARIKLRGEMPADLMYGCGGDRAFAQRMNLTLPDFLQRAWDAGSDDHRIVTFVKQAAARKTVGANR